MQKPPQQPPVFGENIAGRLFDVVRELQKNRERDAGVRRPTPLVSQGQAVINALTQSKQNEQKQNAPSAPGALQNQGSEKQGWQRDVGQGKA